MEEKQVKGPDIIIIAKECSKILLEKKAQDVLLIDLRSINNYLDYFIILTGNSFIHCKSLAKEAQKYFATISIEERTKSRLDTGWVVLDYNDIIVHIFTQETRDYYQLEKLWADGEFIDF